MEATPEGDVSFGGDGGWHLAGAGSGAALPERAGGGDAVGAERAAHPGRTVTELAAEADARAADTGAATLSSQAFNRVLACPACGKKCAVSMTTCNGCGAPLDGVAESKTENLFVGFALGAGAAAFGPLTMSLRRESEDALVFDDPLALSRCHVLAVPTRAYVSDVRGLFVTPADGLAMLRALEAEAWAAVRDRAISDTAFRDRALSAAGRALDEDGLRARVVAGFNLPPSQYQLHLQYILPPLLPSHLVLLRKGVHFQAGRFVPLGYALKALEALATSPAAQALEGASDMSAGAFFAAVEAATGVSYEVEHARALERAVAANAELAAYETADFTLAVRGAEVRALGGAGADCGELPSAASVVRADTKLLQGYGRAPSGMRYYSHARPLGPLPMLGTRAPRAEEALPHAA